MEIYQLIYTSCRKGLGNGPGFQVYSMSGGISDSEKIEIESHCVYIPPLHLPARPAEEEIETLFPRTFSYFRLSSGKYGAASIRYSGKDYSGRYGNYLCHVLLWKNNLSVPPVSLYNSPSFRSGLTEEEEKEVHPLETLCSLEPGDILNFDTIMEFAMKKMNTLKEFISRVLFAYMEGMKVTFTCEDEDIPFYMGAAHLLVPPSISKNFSFTTYTQQIDNLKYFISAVREEGAGYSRYKLEKGLDHCFINLKKDTRVEGMDSVYVNVLFSMGSEAEMVAMVDFVSGFRPEKVTDLDNPALLYGLIKGTIQDADLPIIEVILKQAMNVLDIESLKNLWNMIYDYLSPRSITLPLDGMDNTMLLFLSKGISRIKEEKLNGMLFNLVVNICDSTLEQGKESHNLVDLFARAYAGRVNKYTRWCCYTSHDRIMRLNSIMQYLSSDAVYYHASKLMEYLGSTEVPLENIMEEEGLEELLYNLFYILAEHGRAEEALAPLKSRPSSYAGFNLMMYKHFKNSIHKDYWLNISINWLIKEGADERKVFLGRASCDYLESMFKAAATGMDRARKLYNILCNEVFCSIDKDMVNCFMKISGIYINEVLKPDKFKGSEYKWENLLDICNKKFQWFDTGSLIDLCISIEGNIEGCIFSHSRSSLYNPVFYYTKHRSLLNLLIGLQSKCGIHSGNGIADVLFLLYQGELDSLHLVLGEYFKGRMELKDKFLLYMAAGLMEYMGDETPYDKLSLILIDNIGQQDFWLRLSDIICSRRYGDAEDEMISRMLCLRLVLCSMTDGKNEELYKWLDSFLVKEPVQTKAVMEIERILSSTEYKKAQYIWNGYKQERNLNKKAGLFFKVLGFLR